MLYFIRPHHSFYITDIAMYEEFLQWAQQYASISHLLISEGHDFLMTWRVAFNLWQYIVLEDEDLIINPELSMIYPSTAFILNAIQQYSVVLRYRRHYRQNRGLAFYTAIFITNALFYWYLERCSHILAHKKTMHPLLEFDFYVLFQQQKQSAEGYPSAFSNDQAEVMRFLTTAAQTDFEKIGQALTEAIEEAKSMYDEFEKEGVFLL